MEVINLRYERKCRVDRASKQQVWYHIKHHPAFFREIYVPRQINNIYFDTPQFKYYKANEIGIANRKKVRIRWYGPLANLATSPQLEININSGLVGDKLFYPLSNFLLSDEFSPDFFVNLAKDNQLPAIVIEELKHVRPTLFNTYYRSYFQSANKKFRLTFDEAMSFYRPTFLANRYLNGQQNRHTFIIELKYQLEQDHLAREVFQHFPYRLSKNSKYVNGVNLLQLV